MKYGPFERAYLQIGGATGWAPFEKVWELLKHTLYKGIVVLIWSHAYAVGNRDNFLSTIIDAKYALIFRTSLEYTTLAGSPPNATVVAKAVS